MATERVSSVDSNDGVVILRNAWGHLSTQNWHHSPSEDLQHCHDFIAEKMREVRRFEDHKEFFGGTN